MSPSTTASPNTSLPPAAVWVPGTHVALVPPAGWDPAAGFTGFSHAASSSTILVAELPAPFSQIKVGMTNAAFAQQAIEITSREETTAGGLPALLLEGTQKSASVTLGKVILIVGTESMSAIVSANYPQDDGIIQTAVRAALRSVILDPARQVDPTDALGFTITPSPPLRFAGVLANSAIYDASGKIPAADPLEPALSVAPSLGAAPVKDVEAFARQRLAQTPQYLDSTVLTVEQILVGDLAGVELTADAKSNLGNAPIFVYQLLLVQGDGYVLMSGSCRKAEAATCLEAFRKTTATYRPKT